MQNGVNFVYIAFLILFIYLFDIDIIYIIDLDKQEIKIFQKHIQVRRVIEMIYYYYYLFVWTRSIFLLAIYSDEYNEINSRM